MNVLIQIEFCNLSYIIHAVEYQNFCYDDTHILGLFSQYPCICIYIHNYTKAEQTHMKGTLELSLAWFAEIFSQKFILDRRKCESFRFEMKRLAGCFIYLSKRFVKCIVNKYFTGLVDVFAENT